MSDDKNNQANGGDNGGGHGNDDKSTTIIVNTRKKEVRGKEVTFDQIVGLAFDNPPTGENVEITVAYRKGEGNKPSGTLHPGESVKAKEGMIFDVTATDKS